MAITVTGFPLGWLNIWELGIDVEGATTLRASLHTATFAPNRDTMDFQDDLTNELATANGYAVATLANVALTYDSATDQVRLDFDDISWTFTADQTWRYSVIWLNTAGAASTDPLMLLLDWATSQTVSGVYTIQLDPAGIYAWDFT